VASPVAAAVKLLNKLVNDEPPLTL